MSGAAFLEAVSAAFPSFPGRVFWSRGFYPMLERITTTGVVRRTCRRSPRWLRAPGFSSVPARSACGRRRRDARRGGSQRAVRAPAFLEGEGNPGEPPRQQTCANGPAFNFPRRALVVTSHHSRVCVSSNRRIGSDPRRPVPRQGAARRMSPARIPVPPTSHAAGAARRLVRVRP